MFQLHPRFHQFCYIIWLLHAVYIERFPLIYLHLQTIDRSQIFPFKVLVNVIARNIPWTILSILDQRSSIHASSLQFNNTICYIKPTVKNYSLYWTKDRFANYQHESNRLSKFLMLFWTSLWWTIFPLYNLCSPNYWRQATKNRMPLVTKLMGLPANTHNTRIIRIKPSHHTFVQNIDLSRVEFFLDIIVPQFFHLSHFQKRISGLYLLIGVSQSSKYILKTIWLIYSFNIKGDPWKMSVIVMD